MKTCNDGPIISIAAPAALLARRFIGFDGNLCAADAKALGVSELATATGEQCPVRISAIAVVESGGELGIGDRVVSDSIGRAVAATAVAVAAPVVDDTKLTIDSGAVAVLSSAANGAIITAASGLLAAPVLSGSVLPQQINGTVLDAASGAGEFVRVLLAA